MRKDVFEKKAEQMGDFCIYYQKPDSNVITFAICTAELDNPYIKARMRKTSVDTNIEVLMWNWRYNSQLKVSFDRIKKLIPLASMVKNQYV